jgi:hypothetical protein
MTFEPRRAGPRRRPRILPWLAASSILALSSPVFAQDQAQASTAELGPAERQAAADLAAQAVERAGLRTGAPLVLAQVELFRDKDAEARGTLDRMALVTHYRYDDTAILTRVDLTRRAVVAVEAIPHLAVSLSTEEFERAKTLALSDAAVKAALAPYGELAVEALVVRATAATDPLFGHRVVRLLFRRGRDYLHEPLVLVDLTASRVTIETSKPGR